MDIHGQRKIIFIGFLVSNVQCFRYDYFYDKEVFVSGTFIFSFRIYICPVFFISEPFTETN
jgi:hypothetical protein